jgi:hypothetical protein
VTIVLLSVNIEGLHSNKAYLQTLIDKYHPDFILLQETWLFSFQTSEVENIFPEYKCICKSVDDEDPFIPHKAPRGYGGTAILWKKNFTGITVCPGNTHRMITITQRDLAITNVYLPCRGSYSNQDFYSEIDRLTEICTQFNDHKHLIAGDFNVDILKKPDGRTKYLEILMQDFNLKDRKSDGKCTYFDKAGKFSSRIDYILFNSRWEEEEIIYSKVVHKISNTSPHVGIMTECKFKRNQVKMKENKENKRPKWEKGDLEKYDTILKEMLSIDCPLASNEAAIDYLIETILAATSFSIPGW